jgi:hypothetical protein
MATHQAYESPSRESPDTQHALKRGLQVRGNFTFVFIVFCFGRLALLAFRLGPMIGSTAHYDYRHFLELAQLSDRGLYPYLQYWVEYPPILLGFPSGCIG